MRLLLLALLLSGCCSLKYPLDGKAQSLCRRCYCDYNDEKCRKECK